MRRLLALSCVSLFLLAASANAGVISAFVDDASNGTARSPGAFPQAGYGFFANVSGTAKINRLGYYDAGGDGLSESHTVALCLYNGSQPENYTVVAKATISAGTSTLLSDGYRWVEIPEYTLADTRQNGAYYVLVASHGATDVWYDNGVDAVTGQTFGTITNGMLGWSDPIPELGASGHLEVINYGGSAYGGANMGYAVPEPSTIVLLTAGLIGLLAYAWRKRK